MAKVLVLYYSSYGHIEAMAKAVADGRAQRRAQRSTSSARPRPRRRRSWKLRTSRPIMISPSVSPTN